MLKTVSKSDSQCLLYQENNPEVKELYTVYCIKHRKPKDYWNNGTCKLLISFFNKGFKSSGHTDCLKRSPYSIFKSTNRNITYFF